MNSSWETKYNYEENLLIQDIPHLSIDEARNRCQELFKLIPLNVDLNPVRLNNTLKQYFQNHKNYNKYFRRIFIINATPESDRG